MNASRHAAVSASFTYALLLSGSGVFMPFFPIWLTARGFGPREVGLLLGIPMLMRVLASAPLARIGDGALGPRRTFLLMMCGTAFFYATLFWARDFVTVALALVVATAFYAPCVPLLDSIVLDGVAAHGHDYGRIRQWGSVAWLGTSLGAGLLLGVLPVEAVPPILTFLSAAAVLVGLTLPDDRRRGARRTADAAAGSVPDRGVLLVLCLGLACIQGAHAFLYTFGTLIWQGIGFTALGIGGLWAIGVVFESAMFLFGGSLAGALGPWRLFAIGAGTGILRWIAFGFEPHSTLAIALLQASHGVTFAAVHLATMQWLGRYEVGRAARQGTVAAYIGAGLTIGTVTAGYLYSRFHEQSFFIMAGVSLIGLALVLRAASLERARRFAPPPPRS